MPRAFGQRLSWNLRTREILSEFGFHLILLLGAIFWLLPFFWMVSTALKPVAEIFSPNVTLLPVNPTLDNYTKVWASSPFARYLLNSFLVAILILVGQILTIVPAAYAFAKRDFPGKKLLFSIFLATMMIPFHVTIIPNYLTLAKLGWIDSYAGLIIPFLTSVFGIFLLRQFFLSVSNSLLDAARIDGCSELWIMWLVLARSSLPALAAFSVFSFVRQWNLYIWPLIIIESTELKTVTLGLVQFASFESHGVENAGTLMAASSLVVIPIMLVFLLAQQQFIEGITTTGVKG